MNWVRIVTGLLLLPAAAIGQGHTEYKTPPQAIVDIADAAPVPRARLSPMKTWLVILEEPAMPAIGELAREELRLAGLRFHPADNAASRRRVANGLRLTRVADGSRRAITGLPDDPRIDHVQFSPDGTRIAFSHTTDVGMELWVIDIEQAKARRLRSGLAGIFRDSPYHWLSDSQSIIAKVLPGERGRRPAPGDVPQGPVIQETGGEKSPARTYQDLLLNPHDEALFEFYGTAQLVRVGLDGSEKMLGDPGLFASVRPSPDAKILLIERLVRPFSYLVPYYRFAYRVEVWDADGSIIREVARLPLAENVPVGRNAVVTGPRSFGWRADEDATIYWVEAQDEGNPKVDAEVRDKLFALEAPFDGSPQALASFEFRFRNVYWGNSDTALVRTWWWADRRERLWQIDPNHATVADEPLFDYSSEDRYNVPGLPLVHTTPRGTQVLFTAGDEQTIYLVAEGASAEGNRPFVDALNLETLEKSRIFRSEAPYYETPLAWIDAPSRQLLTRRESRVAPPNYVVRDLRGDKTTKLTEFADPYPGLAAVKREIIHYERGDGINLTATLYLPPNYTEQDGPLPMLVWAYPREFKSADAASQVRESPHRFSRVSWGSPLYWLTQGYAILERAAMPIVGEGDEEPNDSYIEQLVASAEAAVNEAVRRGIADPDRVAIGGHSYGAFMAANLLAHSDIFRAGIARSGAYNRTLTPFGFQAEERTFWEAPDIYFRMSPFMHAQQINEPLLLIHGEADNNSGTFPLQSRRFFSALKGHGATARLVLLPHESHGYQARESVLHTLWEMNTWLERHVKNAPPRQAVGIQELR